MDLLASLVKSVRHKWAHFCGYFHLSLRKKHQEKVFVHTSYNTQNKNSNPRPGVIKFVTKCVAFGALTQAGRLGPSQEAQAPFSNSKYAVGYEKQNSCFSVLK